MRSPLPYDSKTWTLKQIVEYAAVAAYSGLDTIAHDPQEWLYNNLYLTNSHSETYEGGPYAMSCRNSSATSTRSSTCCRSSTGATPRSSRLTARSPRSGTRYPKGSWILRIDQPLGRWIDQLLRIDQYPDSARKCSTAR